MNIQNIEKKEKNMATFEVKVRLKAFLRGISVKCLRELTGRRIYRNLVVQYVDTR